jgi:hypothetical protein
LLQSSSYVFSLVQVVVVAAVVVLPVVVVVVASVPEAVV